MRFRAPPGTERLAEMGLKQASADVRATQAFPFPSGSRIIRAPIGTGPSGPPPIVEQGGAAALVRSIAPPWREKLGPVSRDFNVQDFELTLAAGAGSTIESPTFRLPSANVGWLQQFQLYVLSQTAATSIEWSLRFNGGAVPGFSNKRNFPGVANLEAVDLNGLQVRIPMGALISVVVTNLNAAGPWTVGTGFAGWHHSLQAELDRWGPV